MKQFSFLTTALLLLFSGAARADLSKTTLFSLNTMYIDRDYDDNGTKTQAKTNDTDLRITRVDKQFSYGAIYSMSSNDASDANRKSYGISVGYYSVKDFYVNLHYFISSKYSFGSGTEYSKGNGYGVDLGFLSKITSSFYVGLVITHRGYSYTEISGSGASASVSSSHKELVPLFSFAVAFQ